MKAKRGVFRLKAGLRTFDPFNANDARGAKGTQTPVRTADMAATLRWGRERPLGISEQARSHGNALRRLRLLPPRPPFVVPALAGLAKPSMDELACVFGPPGEGALRQQRNNPEVPRHGSSGFFTTEGAEDHRGTAGDVGQDEQDGSGFTGFGMLEAWNAGIPILSILFKSSAVSSAIICAIWGRNIRNFHAMVTQWNDGHAVRFQPSLRDFDPRKLNPTSTPSRRIAHRKLLRVSAPLRENRAVRIGVCTSCASCASCAFCVKWLFDLGFFWGV
jgi:hypothetical protein